MVHFPSMQSFRMCIPQNTLITSIATATGAHIYKTFADKWFSESLDQTVENLPEKNVSYFDSYHMLAGVAGMATAIGVSTILNVVTTKYYSAKQRLEENQDRAIILVDRVALTDDLKIQLLEKENHRQNEENEAISEFNQNYDLLIASIPEQYQSTIQTIQRQFFINNS